MRVANSLLQPASQEFSPDGLCSAYAQRLLENGGTVSYATVTAVILTVKAKGVLPFRVEMPAIFT